MLIDKIELILICTQLEIDIIYLPLSEKWILKFLGEKKQKVGMSSVCISVYKC